MERKLALFLIMLSLGACVDPKAFYVHTPAKVFTPGLTDAGDIKADVSGKMQDRDNGHGDPYSFSSDVAWSPKKHVAIFASYRAVNDRAITYDRGRGPNLGSEVQKFDLNGSAGDMAAGYFSRTGEMAKWELYAGGGAGNLVNSSTYSDPGYYRVRYYRLFTQGAIGFDYDVVSIMGGGRLSMEKFTKFDHSGNNYFSGSDSTLYNSVISELHPFFDPFFEVQLGIPYAKFNMQLGYDIGLRQRDPNVVYRPSAGYVTMGLVFYYNPVKGRQKKKNNNQPAE